MPPIRGVVQELSDVAHHAAAVCLAPLGIGRIVGFEHLDFGTEVLALVVRAQDLG